MAFHDFTRPWADTIYCLLSPCKQQATETEPQAAVKSDVNLGQSANSLQTNTTEINVSNNQSNLAHYLQIQAEQKEGRSSTQQE